VVDRARRLPVTPVLVAHGLLLAAVVAAEAWLGSRDDTWGIADVVYEAMVVTWFGAAGIALWGLRPRSRTGPWILALSYLTALAVPHNMRIPPTAPGYPILTAVGVAASWLPYAVSFQLALSYPSGRLPGRAERALVAAATAVAAVCGPVLLVTRTVDPATCGAWCYESPLHLVSSRRLYTDLQGVNTAVWLAIAVAGAVLLARQAARAAPRRRRVLVATFTGFGVAILLFAGHELAGAVAGLGSPAENLFYYAHAAAGAVALVVPSFAGLLGERLAFGPLAVLVGRLGDVPAPAVEAALRDTLRDPGLRVAFRTAEGLVDLQGHLVVPPGDGSQTATHLAGPTGAVLLHDPALADRPQLLDAAAAAAGLALENARLTAEVRHQLAEVQASRRRISAAADAERGRLERDLHDGAQQRLLGLGLALAALRSQLGDAQARDLVDEVTTELTGTIADLRELARGIRPAVLTDQGLGPALAALARRCASPVRIDVHLTGRLDPVVEAAGYYVVSEALQNTVKHAPSADVAVRAVQDDGRLVVEIADNGPGGAVVTASGGLRGLADRVSAVGGDLTVTSPPGGGTRLRAELPCG
jgi:signal transduction histidine kinase